MIHNHQALDSNIAHRTSDFEFFSKLLGFKASRSHFRLVFRAAYAH